MRNLKRALSLALASVMVLGMMVVGAGAASFDDFSDKDKIVNTEAVSILNTLNVINGKDDGSFDPTGIVTRAEMAKMICVILNGGKDPNLGSTTSTSYSDTAGTWAAAYIEFCTNQGIVGGDGTGKFNPTNTVTGQEAAKMLLVAMGYNADYAKMVGPQWATSVNVLANTKGLYDELSIDPATGLTRDDAAQMVYNALNIEMVKYENAFVTGDNGTLTSIATVKELTGQTILTEKFKAVRIEGVVTSNEFVNNSASMEGKTTLAISNNDELALVVGGTGFTNSTFEVSTGKDEFGRAVILYVKPSTASPKNGSKAEVISSAILDESNNTVVSTTKGFGTGKTIQDYAKDSGLKINDYAGSGGAEQTAFLANYSGITAGATASGTEFGKFHTSNNDWNYANNKGTEIILIDNDADGIVEYALQNTYSFGRVTKYSTKDDGSVTVKTNGDNTLVPSNEELENIAAYDDVAKDDYVNVTKVSDTYYIVKAEEVNGVLEAYKGGKNVTVDGTQYDYSEAGTAYTTDGLKAMSAIGIKAALDEDVTLYLDAFGYAVAGDTKAASDFLFVANASWSNNATGYSNGALTAYVVMQDGTTGSYTVDKYTNAAGTEVKASAMSGSSVDAIKGNVFKYSLSNDEKLTLVAAKTAPGANEQGEVKVANTKYTIYTKGESSLKYDATNATGTGASTKYVTNDTVVFYVTLDGTSIDKVQVYTGKTAPSMNYAAGAQVWSGSVFASGTIMVTNADTSSNLDAVVFVNSQAVASDYLYLVNWVRTTGDGDLYNAIVDGEFTQVVLNEKDSGLLSGAYGYSMDGDLYDVDHNTYKLSSVGEVTLIDNKSIVLANGNEGKIDGNTTTAFLDDDDTETDVSIGKGDIVCLVIDETGKAEGIFVIAEYDDTAHGVEYYDRDIVSYNSSSKIYTADVSDYNAVTGGTLDTVSELKSLFAVSGKATTKLMASDPTGTPVSGLTTEVADSAVIAGADLYLVVIAESADSASTTAYTVYHISVVS